MKLAVGSIIAFVVVTLGASNASAANRFSVATGNWNSTSTWSDIDQGAPGFSVPVAGDVVTITRGFTVTVDISSAACGSLQLGKVGGASAGTGALTFAASGSPSLTVSGAVSLGGTSTTNGSTGTITFTSGSSMTAGSLVLGGSNGGNAGTLTMTAGGTLTIGGAITIGADGGTWTPGTGTVILTATNTLPSTIFTSFNNLTISGGATTLGVNLNSTAAGTLTVKAGTTLALSTFTYGATTAPASLTMEGGATTGASITGSGVLTLGGNVAINDATTGTSGATISCSVALTNAAARTFTVADDGTAATDLTISGIVSTSGSITKAGAGTLALNGNNTFTGGVTINAGVLQLGNAGALNSTTPNAVTFGASSTGKLQLNGNSVSISGLNTNATIGTPVIEDGVAGTHTLTVNTGGANTYAGVLQNGAAGTLALTKSGAGTLSLSGGNTYSGTTTLSAGTLNINNAAALGTGTFTISGASTIDNTTGGAITLSNNNVQNWNSDFTFTGTQGLNLGTGAVTPNAGRQITVTANTLTVGGAVGGAINLTKAGAGTLVLSGLNTYTGTSTISAGTLSINTLQNVSGGSSSLGAPTTVANGTIAVGATGILQYTGTGHSSNRVINLTASGGSLDASGSGTLTLSGGVTGNTFNLVLTGAGAGVESGAIATTTGTVTKNGTGTWTLSGSNTFSGAVTISAGTLSANTLANAASNSSLGTGSTTPTVSIGATGVLQYTGTGHSTSRVIALTASGGTIDASGSGAMTLSGGVTGNTFNLVLTGTGLGAESGVIATTTGALAKSGTGTWTLSGLNTYTGLTNINVGIIKFGNHGGAASGPLGNIGAASGTVVANGAALDLAGFNENNNELLTLNGTGGGGGALRNSGGADTYAGLITLGSSSSIAGAGGTIAVSNVGTITGSGFDLTLGGAQGGTLTSILGTAGGKLIKDDAGAWTLPTANTFTGGATLNAGTLNINNAASLGTVAGTFTITGGAVDNTSGANITTNNYPLALNGDFTYSGSVPRNLNLGTGGVTLNANRQITVTAGTLTIGGTISAATRDLTKAGAGTLSFGGNAVTLNSLTISAGTLVSTSVTMNLTGNFSNSGAFTNNGGTVNFNGSSAQISGGSASTAFSGLTIANTGAGTTTMNTSGSVSGTLTLTTDLTVTSPAILTQSGSSSGVGDVVGTVRRAGTGSFGNTNVIITITAGAFASFDVTLVKGTTSLQTAVKRQYQLTPNTPLSLQATVRLRYLGAELNGNSENTGTSCNLQLWKETGTTWAAQGSTSCDSTDDNNRWVQLTGVASFSPWAIAGPSAPTACRLEAFAASRSDDGVVLEWRTGYEVDNVGFNIYRQDSSGNMVRLTPHMVAGSALMVRRGTPLSSGLAYSWTDPGTKSDESPRYWLEDLDASGRSAWNGPIMIDEYRRPTRPPAPGKGRSVSINALNSQELSLQEQDSQFEPLGQLERKAKAGKVTIEGLSQQVEIAGKPGIKISVKQEGWYRVSQPQLLAAGLPASVDPRKLQLFVDGQQVPMIVRGEQNGKFEAADSIEFYGVGIDTESTNTHVYWLMTGGQGDRLRQTQSRGGASASDSFPYTLQRKDRLYYFSNIPNGAKENFFGAFIYYQPTDQALSVTGIAPAANATLEIAMQGFNAGPHQIGVSVNGAVVGTLSFTDQAYSVATLTFPQALLTEGANTVSLVGQAGTGDFSFVDYMRLTYAHAYRADNNSLKFTADSGRSVTVSGFNNSALRVVDVTDSRSPQEVIGQITQGPQGYSITITTPGGSKSRTLLAFSDAQAKQAAKLTANKVSNLRQSSGSADLVIIGYGDFLSSLQSLKTLRESQGLQTLLVDVEDVYDEFNYGHRSPQALKDFLQYARGSWRKPPKYVLLAGMASFDPKNYLGLGETDLVPTMFVQTTHIETGSDDSLADFNGDGLPEMAVGRLPARNSDEAARMVQKIISYDQAPAGGAGVLLVADVNKDFNFEANNDQLKTRVPASTSLLDIRRGSDPQARQHLLDALNQGKKLVNYTGHGSVDIWEASLLTTTDAAALANAQRLSVVVAMTCLNGYYFDERLESLAHALLNAQNGGAVAVWSSSGLTEPSDQALADQELFRQLFEGASIRLGDAMIKAKRAINDPDVRRTWILIGDPTTRFKQ